jgi:undecaprenyl-diphosphatase
MALAHSGDSPIWLAVLLLTVWLGSAFWKYEAVLDLIGIAITASVVQIIKWRVQRPRPRGQWGQGYRRLDPHSFPSGHAARAIMLATVAIFLGPLWWTLALVIWAPLVGVARVGMRVHYISDVVAGGLCGLVCGLGLGISLTF